MDFVRINLPHSRQLSALNGYCQRAQRNPVAAVRHEFCILHSVKDFTVRSDVRIFK